MIKQYPHFLFVKAVTESTQDGSGNWSSATESWVLHSFCREQSNGKGNVVNGQDGKAIVFASLIHLPSTAVRLKEGTEVLVSESSNPEGIIRIEKQVLKFDLGQLHNRLWL